MLEAILSALTEITSGAHLLYLFGGVVMGLIVGIFPGLGGIVGLSLLLPFLYGMDATSALAMLIGLVAVIPTSDTFTSVLMGIPGSSASQATVLDGFPLAKKGEAARALGAAFSASLYGGIIGALVLTLFIVVARPVILLFTSAELFMLTVLGLSMVGVLAGNCLPKGVLACGLGLLLGALGVAPATGEFRMSFDNAYLGDGLPLVVIGLAMFAVPEIIDLLRGGGAISRSAGLGKGWIQGVKDMWAYRWLCTRCAGIGCIIGALPGLGGSVVDWIAYGHVKQTAKDSSQFGKGDIRGVLAPESANNAKEGGGLIPTLLFAIPGSGSMAVFLGGMELIGLEPGPNMVEGKLNLTYVIIWSLALANVLGAGSCLLISKFVAKLTTIKYVYLAPFMIMVICFAAFQATRDLGDLMVLFTVGLLGILFKRFGWPRPAFLIGFVLADNSETYLYQAVQFYGWDFLLRTGVIIIFVLTIASVWFGARNAPTGETDLADATIAKTKNMLPQAMFAGFVVFLFAWGLYDGVQHSFLGAVYPVGICVTMLPIAIYLFYVTAKNKTEHAANYDYEVEGDHAGREGVPNLAYYLMWLAGFIAAVMLVGFWLAITGFFIIFLRAQSDASWIRILTMTGCGVGFITALSWIMVLDFPGGLLQYYVELPWPLS
ncbi:MAG: tripartite tricarboxylate transporter permease [Proteobacteria bacterium]|nr:tripartite tricarboxylate transporter permease [Pseudomonadota bacterium]MDA1325045.1 tripartite tricarboxylate transporter permease [Pseudomonadota bacterium]